MTPSGVKLPDGGVLRPSTPPPDFDLDLALGSLAKFAARRPSGIALAHYGLLEQPEELLAEADETLRPVGRDGRARLSRGGRHRRGAVDPLRPAARRHRRRPQGEARHHERRPLQRRRIPPLAREGRDAEHRQLSARPRCFAPGWGPPGRRGHPRGIRRRAWPAAPLGESRNRPARCGPRRGPRAARRTPRADGSGRSRRRTGPWLHWSPAAALSSRRDCRSSILALARSFLAWSRCNLPNVERARAIADSFPAAGGATRCVAGRSGPCRCPSRTRQCGGPLRPRAEEVGFEPTVPRGHNGFRDRPIRPLSHSSGDDASRCDLVRRPRGLGPGASRRRTT